MTISTGKIDFLVLKNKNLAKLYTAAFLLSTAENCIQEFYTCVK